MRSKKITIILLNYKRKQNLPLILNAIEEQSLKSVVWLWNNTNTPVNDCRISLEVNSSSNLACWPRWFLASYVETEYVMMIDDDLFPNNKMMIEKAICALEGHNIPNALVGAEGVILGEEKNYWPTYSGRIAKSSIDGYEGTVHLKNVDTDALVDIVKGRCILAKSKSISLLPLTMQNRDFCDDILVSLHLANKRRKAHLISSDLSNSFTDIADVYESIALSKKPNWKSIRQNSLDHYFSTYHD